MLIYELLELEMYTANIFINNDFVSNNFSRIVTANGD